MTITKLNLIKSYINNQITESELKRWKIFISISVLKINKINFKKLLHISVNSI